MSTRNTRGGHGTGPRDKGRPGIGRRAALLALSALLAGGCAVGPTYHRPDAALTAQFSGQIDLENRNDTARHPHLPSIGGGWASKIRC